MFTWICPQCGSEVPPSFTECPNCAKKTEGVETAAPTETASGVASRPPEPVAAPQAVRPTSGPMAPPVPRSSGHIPGWLLTILFAFAFVGVGASVYWGVNYYRGRSQVAGTAPVLENPSKAASKPHPLQKHLEIAGVRFVGDKKKVEARFLLINHSQAEILGLAGTVTMWARTQRSEEDAVGTLSFKVGEIGPSQSREVTAALTTKLKIYELPDWQNVSTDLQITSPPAQ